MKKHIQNLVSSVFMMTILAAFSSLSAEKYALVFGTNYQGESPIDDLNLCEKDAKKMKEQIVKTGNFKSNNVRVFLGKDVTRNNLKKQFVDWLGTTVKKGDQVFVYFSGHGAFLRDPKAKNGMRNYLIMFFRPHVSDEELNEWLKDIKTKKAILIFDACYSGGFAKKGAQVRGSGNIPIPEGYDSVVLENVEDVYFQNKVVIGSSDDNETSIELSKPVEHGLFTYYFSEAILKADLNNDKIITAYEAFFKARNDTIKTAKKVKHNQHPQISGNASGFFFVGEPKPQPQAVAVTSSETAAAQVAQTTVVESAPPPVVDDSKPPVENAPVPQVTIPEAEQEVNPPITHEEPVNLNNNYTGTLVLDTTYRYDITEGKEPQVYLNEKKISGKVNWKKDKDWGNVAVITFSKIPTGVHNISIKADRYPDKILKTGIEKDQTITERVVVSRNGRGSIEGHVWLGNFSNPVPNLMIFLKPIRIPKQPMVKSDKEGAFAFKELKPGNYTVFVRGGVGVFSKPYDKEITVEENKVSKIEIVLKEFFKK
ncbi:MAG: caspase family protein [Spirochaetia bacterium]|nr:caspase family protein [Spirochaetia bacterium]